MINIKVNNATHQLNKECSLESILKKLEISTNGIALAVNLNIITRTDWKTQTLNDGDEVLIIKATQGG
ncbi:MULTISPECIES: sulfur carrier protein ThiS [unclassified Algibacter]|uniref:sulfur carrier protein ThiS n=1 Tax=unclassified Algibacter TaxID=2615009 RepID=UPI00131D5641|nr:MULTISPECIES: sulfur carrier protein ThiS [unclassified Algibacter]MCL5128346.1 sulfur carrier protein ThiS [Algibacter sp. L4_22]